MKKIILFTTVAAVFSTTLISCKKTLKSFPESITYTQPAFSSEHFPKTLTLYTHSGILDFNANFSTLVKESIRFLTLISFIANHITTLWKVSDMASTEGTMFLIH